MHTRVGHVVLPDQLGLGIRHVSGCATRGGRAIRARRWIMSNLVHNERLKYMATFFNNLGLAFLIAGGLGANVKMDIYTANITAWKLLVLGVFACILCVGFAQLALLSNLRE
jgi:hypothetical protein